MAEMTIRLVCDPETGKKDIIVSLERDADALPHEHEQLHRELVNRLIECGVLQPDEVGSLSVEREEGAEVPELGKEGEQRDDRQAQAREN